MLLVKIGAFITLLSTAVLLTYERLHDDEELMQWGCDGILAGIALTSIGWLLS